MIVIGYMSAFTAVNMDHVREGVAMLETGITHDGLKYTICKSFWWDYVIEIGKYKEYIIILQQSIKTILSITPTHLCGFGPHSSFAHPYNTAVWIALQIILFQKVTRLFHS